MISIDWLQAIAQIMVFIDRLQAHLYAGDFVLASRGERREVCKILSVASSQQVKVQWWLTRDDPFFMEEMIMLPPLLDNSSYPNISLYGMNECFDMPSSVSVIHRLLLPSWILLLSFMSTHWSIIGSIVLAWFVSITCSIVTMLIQSGSRCLFMITYRLLHPVLKATHPGYGILS